MAEINKYRIQIPEKKVTFSNPSSATFAFDPANGQGLCYEYTKQYNPDPMGISNDNDGEKFSLCWKFIPPNNSDAVTATLPPGIDRTKLKFITSNLTEITFDAAASGNTVQLTLPGGDARSQYSLHAVYQADDDSWKQVGRMDVITYNPQTLNVKIIPLGDPPANIDQTELAGNLNGIYNRYGINWTLTVDNDFNKSNSDGGKANEILDIIPNYQLTAGDEFFSEYSLQQNELNALYKSYLTEKGSYNNETVYLFVLPNAPEGAKLTTGDMPIGKQWGYLFGSAVDARTLAHELGHGKLELRHTFASEACGSGKQGQSNNLMDYPATGSSPLGGGREGASDSLVCQQWNYIHKPAIIGKVFQDDGAGAINDPNMPAEDIVELIRSIRDAKMQNRNNLDITEFSLSFGKKTELDLTDMQLADVIVLTSGKMKTIISGQPGESRYEPLYIVPSDFSVESDNMIAKSKGLTGYFTKYTFPQYIKNGDNYTKSSTSALIIIVKGNQTQTFKAYLNGEAIPDIQFPCEECGMELLLTQESLEDLLNPDKTYKDFEIQYFNTALRTAKFNTCNRMAHYFAQIKVETDNYQTLGEYTNYRLHKVLEDHNGKAGITHFFTQSFYDDKTYHDYFHYHVYEQLDTSKTNIPNQDYQAESFRTFSHENVSGTIRVPTVFTESIGMGDYALKLFTEDEITVRKKKLFSAIYSGVNGNSSNAEDEDGWYYRGKGVIQLTGYEVYKDVSTKCNHLFGTTYQWELRENCDQLISDKKCAIFSSVAYFEYRLTDIRNKGGISFLDLTTTTVRNVTYEVNGGYNHLDLRIKAYDSFINVNNGIYGKCFHFNKE